MHGMTTLASSINFLWRGLAFCWFSVGVCLLERNVLGIDCLVRLCEGDPFLLQETQV